MYRFKFNNGDNGISWASYNNKNVVLALWGHKNTKIIENGENQYILETKFYDYVFPAQSVLFKTFHVIVNVEYFDFELN